MAQYSSPRTLSDIRLRNWNAGRVAQLKLAIQKLESQISSSLTQSTQQTAKRQVVNFVPFVLDESIIINSGFQQIQVSWQAPPGLNGHPSRQLLFYEIQYDSNRSFSNPTTLTTPQTTVVLAGLEGFSVSVRIRIVNTFGQASIWSIVQTVRLAKTRIEVTSLADTTGLVGINKRLTKSIGEWQTVMETDYLSFGGAFAINLHASLLCPHHTINVKRGAVTVETYNGGPGYVQCRYLLGEVNLNGEKVFSELGANRFLLSAKPGYLSNATDFEAITPTAFGSFPSVFYTPERFTDPITIRLQVAKLIGSEWKGPTGVGTLQTSDPLFCVRNAQVIEVLEQ